MAEINSGGRAFPEGSYAYLRGRRNSDRILALERKARRQAARIRALEGDLEWIFETLGLTSENSEVEE